MIDTGQPLAPYVFAAARHQDQILNSCKKITLADAANRRFMRDIMRTDFVSLRWLNREKFGDSPEIAAGIDQLEQEVQALVDLPIPPTATIDRWTAGFLLCPVCGGEPNPPIPRYDPTPYWSRCLDLVMPGLSRLRSLETGFGMEAI